MQRKVNERSITLFEVLTNANKSENPVAYLKEMMQKDKRINPVLGYALNPRWKMPLPKETPPYVPSQHPIGVAPLEVLNTYNKLYIMYGKETKQYKKEELFIQWIEEMAPEEALLMLSIKDQSLPSMFENLTIEVFIDAMGWTQQAYLSLVGAAQSSTQPLA